MNKRVVIAFDHGGFVLKKAVKKTLEELGCCIIDVGTNSLDSVDFPDYAFLGCSKILNGEADCGIFVCGSGIGMCLACNKIDGIYASVCHDTYSAHQGVEHDHMNVLCLGGRVIGDEAAAELVKSFIGASFNNKPNQIRRFDKILQIENRTFSLSSNSERIAGLGQSIWYDNIERELLRNGEIARMIREKEIRGITSNPSIFRNAISNTDDYHNALIPLALANSSPEEIFSRLSVADIRETADLFRDLYMETAGLDGYVSLEVCPSLASDCESTINEARRLWTAVSRPNLMIKVPATEACIPSIRKLTAMGINVNATLIFSDKRYTEVAEAYIAGLEDRVKNGDSISTIHSVASVFVSRIDSKVDPLLEEAAANGDESAKELIGETAIRNAQLIYRQYGKIFKSSRFEALAAKGGKTQRPLWASTSTKNPAYPKTKYIEALIGEDTVNTVPPATLTAILDDVQVSRNLPAPDAEIDNFFAKLNAVGIHFERITKELEEEGVNAFEVAFSEMLKDLDIRSDAARKMLDGVYQAVLDNFKKAGENSLVQRMFSKDPTIWTFDTQAFPEIRNRLGWLDTHSHSKEHLSEYLEIRKSLKKEGINKILLLGMGGSSLAPEVLANVFDDETDIKLTIVDSTDPGQVLAADAAHNPKETLYIVSSKSGGTAEILAYLDYFYKRATDELSDQAGQHFIAITDPGTALENRAKGMCFRNVLLSDPSVGGRFSALTPFGVVPAVLMGLEPKKMFERAEKMAMVCAPSAPISQNEGLALGVYMGTAAANSRDKFTIITDPAFSSFGSWLEQLIAESSGKDGKGIIPVDLEPELPANEYAADRAFVYLKYSGDHNQFVDELLAAGQPVYVIKLEDLYDLFGEFYRWEIAISIACSLLQVNAFDQPNVQDSKTRTVAKIDEYHKEGKLIQPDYNWKKDGVQAYVPFESDTLHNAENLTAFINSFIKMAKPGENYIAINAYLPRNEAMITALQNLRRTILETTKCAVTLGFGPRFQHSTGQLHKGGKNNGLFIQLVADCPQDAEIPNENLSFAVLERAQALGDFESLMANNRKAVRIDLDGKSIDSLI